MNHHLHAPCAAVLCLSTLYTLVPLAAQAQSVYKCTTDGKVAYSDMPCAAGATAASLKVPPAPVRDPADAGNLKRLQKEAAAMEKARHARDDVDARAAAKAAQQASVQRKKCAKLELTKRWADDDLRRAGSATVANTANATSADGARLRAKRAAEALALECPR